MKTRLFVLIAGAALALPSAVLARPIVTFDDLPGAEDQIPNGYGGLNWNNMYYLNGLTYGGGGSGYENGVVSGKNVGYNGYGDPAEFSAAAPFTFNSVYVTGAWNDGMTVTFNGYLGLSLLFTTSGLVSTNGPTQFTFNWSGIDRVVISTSGGSNHGYSGLGTHVALDNLTYNGEINIPIVPLPAALPAGLAGLGLVAWMKRRRTA